MKSPWFSLNHISHLATVEIRVVRLGSFQNLYISFAIVEITHGVTANRDDTDFHHAKPQILYEFVSCFWQHLWFPDKIWLCWLKLLCFDSYWGLVTNLDKFFCFEILNYWKCGLRLPWQWCCCLLFAGNNGGAAPIKTVKTKPKKKELNLDNVTDENELRKMVRRNYFWNLIFSYLTWMLNLSLLLYC